MSILVCLGNTNSQKWKNIKVLGKTDILVTEWFIMKIISREEILTRELQPLKQIKDSYPKIIIANTKHDNYDIGWIKIYDIARWLMN